MKGYRCPTPSENESPIKTTRLHRSATGRRSSVGRAPGCYPGCPRFEPWRWRRFCAAPREKPRVRPDSAVPNATNLSSGSSNDDSRARISVWLERAAHNRFVLGSNPSGPIFRRRTDVRREKCTPIGFATLEDEEASLPPVQIRAGPLRNEAFCGRLRNVRDSAREPRRVANSVSEFSGALGEFAPFRSGAPRSPAITVAERGCSV